MEAPSEVRQRPDVSADERATHEAVKRILKLRWMGMEEEAERIEATLQRTEQDALLAEPSNTD